MKILNIFKKEKKSVKKNNIEKLDKKQLEKVIGGTVVLTSADSIANITRDGEFHADANGVLK